MCSVAHPGAAGPDDTLARRGDLAGFRRELYTSFTARVDALFELTDGAVGARNCAHSP